MNRDGFCVATEQLCFVIVFRTISTACLPFLDVGRANLKPRRRDSSVSASSAERKRESIVVDGRVEKEKQHNDEHNAQQLVRPHIQICMRNSGTYFNQVKYWAISRMKETKQVKPGNCIFTEIDSFSREAAQIRLSSLPHSISAAAKAAQRVLLSSFSQ